MSRLMLLAGVAVAIVIALAAAGVILLRPGSSSGATRVTWLGRTLILPAATCQRTYGGRQLVVFAGGRLPADGVNIIVANSDAPGRDSLPVITAGARWPVYDTQWASGGRMYGNYFQGTLVLDPGARHGVVSGIDQGEPFTIDFTCT